MFSRNCSCVVTCRLLSRRNGRLLSRRNGSCVLTCRLVFSEKLKLCSYPGGKVRAISRGVLARGDIARDPARSRQIPWFRVRLRKGAKRRDYARSRVHIRPCFAPRFKGAQTGVEHKASMTTFFVFSNSSRRAMPSPSRGTGRKAIDREKAWLAANAS